MKIFGQRDPLWSQKKLGYGTGTLGDYGCTLTCLSMMSEIRPDILNVVLQGDSFEKSAFAGATKNLIWWTRLESLTNGTIKFHWRGYGYDEAKIKAAIEKHGACLVEVDFDGTGRDDDRHWILAIGNKKAYDPWTGNEIPTNKYTKWLGWAEIEVVKKGGTMPGDNTGGLPSNYADIIHGSSRWDETVGEYLPGKKPKEATLENLKSSVANLEKKSYDNGYRSGEKHVMEVYADERVRLEHYDSIIFPDGNVPEEMDEIDVFEALEELYLKRKSKEKDEKAGEATKESIKEPLRYVVGLVIGAAVTYVYSQYPILGTMGVEQQALTTSLIALVIRGVDKYLHTKDSSIGIDQTIKLLMPSGLADPKN